MYPFVTVNERMLLWIHEIGSKWRAALEEASDREH